MKRSGQFILIFILTTLCVVSLCACTKQDGGENPIPFTSGDFICVRLSLNGNVLYILGLSEEGKKKEVIMIPGDIDGEKIYGMSKYERRNIYDTVLAFMPDSYSFESENLKKVYWNKPGGSTYNAYFGVDIIVQPMASKLMDFNGGRVYVSDPSIYPDRVFAEPSFMTVDKVNCFFYVQNNVYWVDHISEDGDGVYLTPHDPVLTGFDFEGWYLDPECKNAWNGEFALPAGSETLSLYAKLSEHYRDDFMYSRNDTSITIEKVI